MNRSYVLEAFMETPWAIIPNRLAVLEEIVMRHVRGEKLEPEEIEARIHGASRPVERQVTKPGGVNSVAVLPLFGTIFPRANLMTEMSGATSAETFGANFAKLLDNPEVDAIVLDVNSPGGSVYGIPEVSKMIFDARGRKPIVAVANHLMASAAYWIGSAADEIVVTPSGDVGSIGVFAVHQDMSAALEKAGLKMSLISAGKYKVEGNPYQPLGEEAQTAIQTSVDEVYDAFVEAIARNRGVKAAIVRNGFGEGRVVGAEEAVKLGMADSVATMEETINRLFNSNVPAALKSAAHTEVIGDQGKDAINSDGQVPVADGNVHTQEARARLASVGIKSLEGETTMLRELLNKRNALVARASELVEVADKENRDLTEDERKEFNEIMGEGSEPGQVGALDQQIEKIMGEREKLRTAAEKKFSIADPQKPEPVKNSQVMKLADFNQLAPADRMKFVNAGGKIEG